MPEVFYSGAESNQVMVREGDSKRPLDPRFDLAKLSPSGFRWGSGADSPAQLSLALLADSLRDDVRALKLHHSFVQRVVAIMPERWTITRSRILAYANMIEHRARLEGDVTRIIG